jgi:hypothetical protein
MTIDSVDEIIKLLLGISLSFAIFGIALQIMRLIGKVTDSIQDVRGALKNTSTLTDYILEDYIEIRKAGYNFMDKFNSFISTPVASFGIFLKALSSLKNSLPKRKKKEKEEDRE